MSSKRIAWVDIFKAITIILVVIGHSNSPINGYIYCFHIPAFFFISGYTTDLSKSSFWETLKKKFLSLIVPFIAVNCLYVLLKWIMTLAGMHHVFYTDSLHTSQLGGIFRLIFRYKYTVDVGGATWFIVILFETILIAKIIFEMFRKVLSLLKMSISPNWFVLGFSVVTLLFSYYLYSRKITLNYGVDLAFISFFYFMMGTLFRQKNVFESRFFVPAVVIPVSAVVLWLIVNVVHFSMNWPTRSFSSNPLVNVIGSLSGILIIYFFSILCEKQNLLRRAGFYLGARTLCVLVFHFVFFRLFFLLMYITGITNLIQVQSLVPLSVNYYWPLLTIFAVGMSLCLDSVIRKNRISALLMLGIIPERKQ